MDDWNGDWITEFTLVLPDLQESLLCMKDGRRRFQGAKSVKTSEKKNGGKRDEEEAQFWRNETATLDEGNGREVCVYGGVRSVVQ